MRNIALMFACLAWACGPEPRSAPSQETPPVAAASAAIGGGAWWASALDPVVIAERLARGRLAETSAGEGVLPPELVDGAPAYFRTYAQIKTALDALATTHPELVEIIDLGPSGETVRGVAQRSVLLLRLSDRRVAPERKAKALVYAGTHAREIANPELVLRFATELLQGYGLDANATALLHTRQIDIVPIVNPDGHAVVERGFAGDPDGDTWHRKTTTPPDGVDANRNHPFRWGGVGASSSPYAQDYRGPDAGSEPEVQALRALAARERYAVALDFHSYSRLNMWPWGDTSDPAPDQPVLRAIGLRFTQWNGYSPVQSVDLYPTTGTLDDGTYGETGAITLALETGDSFLQDDDEFAETCRLNLPVIAHMVALAPDPRSLAFGPEVREARVEGGSLAALAEDFSEVPAAIAAAEWTLDPATPPGAGHALAAADGRFDGVRERLMGEVEASAESLLFVRARTQNGGWGPLHAAWVK